MLSKHIVYTSCVYTCQSQAAASKTHNCDVSAKSLSVCKHIYSITQTHSNNCKSLTVTPITKINALQVIIYVANATQHFILLQVCNLNENYR